MNKGLAITLLAAFCVAMVIDESGTPAYALAAAAWVASSVWLSVRVLMGKVDHQKGE